MIVNTELKPCPFCGKLPRTNVEWRECGGNDLVLEFSVKCDNCGIKRSYRKDVNNATFSKYVNMMNEAVKLWNERV